MSSKLFAVIVAIAIFINALAVAFTQVLTSLSTQYPNLSRYAVISLTISSLLAPFLPRIQKTAEIYRAARAGN